MIGMMTGTMTFLKLTQPVMQTLHQEEEAIATLVVPLTLTWLDWNWVTAKELFVKTWTGSLISLKLEERPTYWELAKWQPLIAIIFTLSKLMMVSLGLRILNRTRVS